MKSAATFLLRARGAMAVGANYRGLGRGTIQSGLALHWRDMPLILDRLSLLGCGSSMLA